MIYEFSFKSSRSLTSLDAVVSRTIRRAKTRQDSPPSDIVRIAAFSPCFSYAQASNWTLLRIGRAWQSSAMTDGIEICHLGGVVRGLNL